MALVISNPEHQGISNKTSRSNIIAFREEYRVFYDLVSIAKKAGKDMWLGFQIFEKVGG